MEEGKRDIYMENKIKLDANLIPYTRHNSIWIKELCVKKKSLKFLLENIS